MAQQKHILVIGAGIIGASIAYHLVKSGARVTIVDREHGGGLATRFSWAWINASWGNPEPYFRLRWRSIQEWRRLGAELPDLRVDWAGGLLWDLAAEKIPAYVESHAAWGYDIRLVDGAEAARLEPGLATLPQIAAHASSEGAVEPAEAARVLLAAAVARGADFRAGQKVTALALQGARVTGAVTADGILAADHVVLAAGAATAELAASAGVRLPMSAPAGLLVVTRPCPKILNGLVMAPDLHVRQRRDGALIAGTDFAGTDPGTEPQKVAEAIFGGLRRLLKAGPDLAFDHYTVGYRPLPADDLPAVGSVPGHANLTLAVMHSGITLAPAMGLFLAEEILSGVAEPLLRPYQAARLAR